MVVSILDRNLSFRRPALRSSRYPIILPTSAKLPLAHKRIQASSIEVEYCILNGESLLMADDTFDRVVSTWTLWSIAKVERAIEEIGRVLKLGDRLFFLEHRASNAVSVRVWPNSLTPIQKMIADSCHLNRNIQFLVAGTVY